MNIYLILIIALAIVFVGDMVLSSRKLTHMGKTLFSRNALRGSVGKSIAIASTGYATAFAVLTVFLFR